MLAPELFGLGEVQALQPVDVAAVGRWPFEFQILATAERFGQGEDFIEQQYDCAAVEQKMMKRPDELEGRFAGPQQRQAHRGSDCQVATTLAIGVEVSFEARRAFRRGQAAPVLLFKGDAGGAMNFLPRFGQAFPSEAGPQDFMPLGGALPRAPEGRNVKLFAQRAEDLFDVHSRLTS